MAAKIYNRALLFSLSFIFSMMLCTNHVSAQNDTAIIDTTDYLPYPEGLNTNLMIAAAKGYTSEVHRLIKLGADVDARGIDNISPLIYAVANNRLTTVKALLEYNPDTGLLTYTGESALHIAVKDNMPGIAEALIRADANINIKDPAGATPLHYASAYGYLYMCDLLLYYNADYEARAKDGTTPLIASVYSGQANISDLLLQTGASPDMPGNEGFTPLIIAAQNNDTLMMNLLLKAGASPFVSNNYRYDALGMAVRNNHYEAFKFMMEMAEPGRYTNSSTISPVVIARKYGRAKILDELENAGFTGPAKLSFDHVKIQAGIKTSFRDYYTRVGISIKDPLFKLMINAGFEMKPSYSKVLVKNTEDSFFQYYDRRYLVYAGAGKELRLIENYSEGNLSLDLNLNAGYMMVSPYRGTDIKPPDKLRIMPQAVLRWNKNNFNIYAGYEFMNTGLYRIGPGWLTFGVSYDIYFDKMRGPLKTIKWY